MLKAVACVLVVSSLAFAQSTLPITATLTPQKSMVNAGETAVLKYGCPGRYQAQVDARYLTDDVKPSWTTSNAGGGGLSEMRISGLNTPGEVRVTLSCMPVFGPGLVRKGQFSYVTLTVVAGQSPSSRPARSPRDAQAEYDQAAAQVASATATLSAARARLLRATENCKATKGCKLSR